MTLTPRSVLKAIIKFVLYFILVFFISLTILFFIVSAPPSKIKADDDYSVNDVTMLNKISVANVCRPTSIDSIQRFVKEWNGKISIGGARHSMGGQIGLDRSLHFDMRSFDNVLAFSPEEKEITVQAGITWRKIQEHIDPYNLSVMIMQTYADFTVGGSLSVNVHGRYIGKGPLIHSVKSIKLVTAEGTLLQASRTENPEIFRAVIGGYGGFGIIVEATLLLDDNLRVKRVSDLVDARDYDDYFKKQIRDNGDVVFHNGDLYPDEYNRVRAVSYVRTNDSLTIEHRLMPKEEDYRLERFAMWLVSELPGGKWIRQHWGDPIAYDQPKVCYRNYEASYNASELEPTSRENSTYVLQEYFVPIDNFEHFVPKMAEIFKTYDANVINVSIRHAHADTLSYLAWAPQEVFCFVIYYKQETTEEAKVEVGKWTRALIDAALEEGGSYYLPYQLQASREQFMQAYPSAQKSFAIKSRLDSAHKFSNKFWNKYYE
jgi:FAD/FMN-containing dehydrogenase